MDKFSVLDLKTLNIFEFPEAKVQKVMFSSIISFVNHGKEAFALFGGRAAPNAASHQLCVIEIHGKEGDLNDWQISISKDLSIGQVHPPARWRHTSTLASDSFKMVVVGGRDEKSVFSDSWVLDLSNFQWKLILPFSENSGKFFARHSHSTVYWKAQKKLVISGGLNDDEQPLNDITVMSLSGDFTR